MKPSPTPRPPCPPSRRRVLRTLAGMGIGSQFDVRRKPQTQGVLKQAQPSPLQAWEEQGEALQTLARRHAPALALSNQHMWPVDVSYTWHDGSDVYVETETAIRRIVIAHEKLKQQGQFHACPASARQQAHFIDAPGGGLSDERWCKAWQRIQGHAEPQAAAYPPTQYVHGFWFDRSQGLLAIQYWFYYPYNDWVNCHEGDWEHVTVVLRGPQKLVNANAFVRHSHMFYFHDWAHEPEKTINLGGEDPAEDHVVVFVGGRGDLWKLWRCGRHQSGGSYPSPGHYSRAGSAYQWLAPSERITQPHRFIAPEEFRLVTLPEPHRVSANHHPDLWWLQWPLYFGQRRVHSNFPMLSALGLDHPPRQPGRHRDWNGAMTNSLWPGRVSAALEPVLPQTWVQRRYRDKPHTRQAPLT